MMLSNCSEVKRSSCLQCLPHVIVFALIRVRVTVLSLSHRLTKIVRAVRNAVATAVYAVLRVVTVTWTLAILLLLLVPILLLALFLLTVSARPFTRVLGLLLLLRLLLPG